MSGRTARAEEAFDAYLQLGPDRSLHRLAASLQTTWARPPSLRTLEAWSVRDRWQDRLATIEREARVERERERVAWLNQYRERLRKQAIVLQTRGLEWLAARRPGDVRAGEAVRAIEAGFRLEALALGEATDHILLEEHDDRFERLSDEELQQFIQGARAREAGGPQ